MTDLFWTSWQAVARAVILCAGGYASLVTFLRISGKRSTSLQHAIAWTSVGVPDALDGRKPGPGENLRT